MAVIKMSANLLEANGFQHSSDDDVEQMDAVRVGEDISERDSEGDLHAIRRTLATPG